MQLSTNCGSTVMAVPTFIPLLVPASGGSCRSHASLRYRSGDEFAETRLDLDPVGMVVVVDRGAAEHRAHDPALELTPDER